MMVASNVAQRKTVFQATKGHSKKTTLLQLDPSSVIWLKALIINYARRAVLG